ncbi:MAG: hypothetical protein R3C49_16675 [Planctomycetaceae bacterium]
MERHFLLTILVASCTVLPGCCTTSLNTSQSRLNGLRGCSDAGSCGSQSACSGSCGTERSKGCTGDVEGRCQSNVGCDFEYGRKNILLDGVGWVTGIPSKLILWNTKVDSHSISRQTEDTLRGYLQANDLTDVKVRVNQYDPLGEWKRLIGNKEIHPAWRYTVGAYAVTKYTLLPGRILGGDEYNPFTNTISLYSDRASIALREGAHARQAQNATYRGLYSSSMFLPGSPLWIDTPATREVIAYSKQTGQRALERESYLVLFPAFGSRLGSSAFLYADAGQAQLLQGSLALVGHAIGRTMGAYVSEDPVQMAKAVMGIVKKPQPEETINAELQDPLPPMETFSVSFVPVDVEYDLFN